MGRGAAVLSCGRAKPVAEACAGAELAAELRLAPGSVAPGKMAGRGIRLVARRSSVLPEASTVEEWESRKRRRATSAS
jgi:hypothetical protein